MKNSQSATADFEPLHRLRHIAEEIRDGLERQDLDLVCQASELLDSALARCEIAVRTLHSDTDREEAAQVAAETGRLLDESESILRQSMERTVAELGRLQKGKRVLALVRTRPPRNTGGTLDCSR